MIQGCEELGEDLIANKIVVTNTYNGHGLERAVVVFVPVVSECEQTSMNAEESEGACAMETDLGVAETEGEEGWLKRLGDYNRRGLWFVASRCVADLVIIHV